MIIEKLLDKVKFDSSSGKRTILCFCGGMRDYRLLFRRPRDWKAMNSDVERQLEVSSTQSESQNVYRENEPL